MIHSNDNTSPREVQSGQGESGSYFDSLSAMTPEQIERMGLVDALKRAGGKKKVAAKALGISLKEIRQKVIDHTIPDEISNLPAKRSYRVKPLTPEQLVMVEAILQEERDRIVEPTTTEPESSTEATVVLPPDPPLEYRSVPGGNEKIYRVGNDGSVWSSKDGGATWDRLTASLLASGHCRVNIGKGNKNAQYVHRLVLQAFGGPPPEPKMFACHKNDVPSDNRINNLYWGHPSDNGTDAVRNQKHKIGQDSPAAKLTEIEVRQIVRLCRAGIRQKAVAEIIGTTPINVQAIMYGLSWSRLTGISRRTYSTAKRVNERE